MGRQLLPGAAGKSGVADISFSLVSKSMEKRGLAECRERSCFWLAPALEFRRLPCR